jgi:hypothetical protein
MLFGHNTNVQAGQVTFHVQTEDRGPAHAHIDTTVYFRGHVLYRRTNNYFDLLPLDPGREHTLKLRVDAQHRAVVEEIRSGALRLPLPREAHIPAANAGDSNSPVTPKVLALELVNSKDWLSGKRALLKIAVRDQANQAVKGARVTARVDGAAEHKEFSAETGSMGRALFEFDMPRLSGAEPALVIEAVHGDSKGHLRFQLRAKPRVPSAS